MRSLSTAGRQPFFNYQVFNQLKQAGSSGQAIANAGKYFLLFAISLISWVAVAQPSAPASAITIAPVSGTPTSLIFTWTNGTGGVGRIVLIKDAAGVAYAPSNGIAAPSGGAGDYTAQSDLNGGSAGVIKCVYNGILSTVTVTNIPTDAEYFIHVYEYSVSSATPTYTFATVATNPIGCKVFTSSANFVVPSGVTTATVQAWGGGGAGGGNTNNQDGGGGGGGGAYALSANLAVAGTIAVVVAGTATGDTDGGATGGNTTFGGTTVVAAGGTGGVEGPGTRAGGAGGTFAASTPSTSPPSYSGGTGGNGRNNDDGRGGGGGSSAAPGVAGAVGAVSGGLGGVAPTGGGNGGNGVLADANGNPGFFPGGGGSGSGSDESGVDRTGGNGAPGLLIVSYPTADVTGPTSTASFTKKFIKNATSQTVTVIFDEAVTGIPTITIDGNLSAPLFTNQVMTIGGDATTWTFNAGTTWATNGEIFTVTVGTATDASLNLVNPNPVTNTFTVDNSAPVAPTVSTVTTNAGGTVVATYYNLSNTGGITVGVVLASDPSLVGGTIELEVDDTTPGAGFIALGSPVTILAAGTTQNVVINHATLSGLGTRYADGKVLRFRARVNDVAGNTVSPYSVVLGSALNIDLVAPATPSVPDLTTATDSNINTDNITNDATPDFSVTGSNGLLLEILDGATVKGSMTATAGPDVITVTTLADGVGKSITARTTEASGNTASSGPLLVTIDTAPPTAPTIPNMTALTDLGSLSTDDITSDNTPDFTVTGTIGFKLELLEGPTVLSTIASASGGAETLTSSALSDGVGKLITARTTDAAGNTATSTALTITIDTAAPDAPWVPDLQPGSDLGLLSTDNLTSDNTPTFNVAATGTAVGLKLELLAGATVVNTIASALASNTPTSSAITPDGIYNFSARTTDLAGNSASSTSLAVTIETVAPTVTSITPGMSPTRGFIPMTGTITADASGLGDQIDGVGTSFTTELFVGAIILNATGTETTPIGEVKSIEDNTNLTLTAIATNNLPAGSKFSIHLYFTVTFNEAMQSSTIATSDFVATLVSATAPSTDIRSIGTNTLTAVTTSLSYRVSVSAAGNGTWRLDKAATACSDIYGNSNSSTYTGGTAATIDNMTPAFSAVTPASSGFTSSSAVGYTLTETNGPLTSGSVTWTRTGGTADPNAPYVINLTGTELISGVRSLAALADGAAATATANMVDGAEYSVSITGTDAAGNVSTTATNTTITVDKSAPASNTSTAVAIGGTVVATYWNSTNTGITVTVSIPNDASLNTGFIQLQGREQTAGTFANVGGTTAIAGGDLGNTKNATLTFGQFEGITGFADTKIIELRAVLTDRAGNSTAGATTSNIFLVDQTFNAPSAPDLTAGSDAGVSSTDNITKNTSLTFTGTSEPGASVQLRESGGNVGSSVVADGSGNWSATVTLSQAVHLIGARQTDVAGNPVSSTSSTVSVTVDTTVPVITATTPVNNAYVNHKEVSYTLSQAAGAGSITWTRTAGSLDAGSPRIQALTGTELNTGAQSNITLTNNPALVDGAIYTITFNADDVAGNSAVTVTRTAITYDITPPTITAAALFAGFVGSSDTGFADCNNNTTIDNNSHEYVHLTISEPLALGDGDQVPIGTPGFSATTGTFDVACGGSNNGASVYHGINTIHLKNTNDGDWIGATTFTFTTVGGTVIKDLAGNEMATITGITTIAPAPLLASSMVLDPNGVGNDIITFTVDQALATVTTAGGVTGITVDPDGPLGVAPSAAVAGTYSTIGNIVTLTASGNVWSGATTVNYTSGGTANHLKTSVNMASFTNEQVLLGPIVIFSNNANTALAKELNEIYVTFTVNPGSLPLSVTPPTVTIGGFAATVTGSNPSFTATLITSGATPISEVGQVAFIITAVQAGRTTTITKTIPGTSVTYDKTLPAKPGLPDLAALDDTFGGTGTNSDNYTKTNSDLSLSGVVDNSSTLGASATVEIFSNAVSIGTTTSNAGTGAWAFEFSPFPAVLPDGVYNITVKATDQTGNTSLLASDPLTITIDNTPPNVVSILRVGPPPINGWSTTNGTSASTITFRVTFDEYVTGFDYSGGGGGGTGSFGRNTTIGISSNGFTGAVATTLSAPYYVDVTTTNVSGTGQFSINYLDRDDVINLVGDFVGGTGLGDGTTFVGPGDGDFISDFNPTNEYYSIVLPEPSASVPSFNAPTITTNSINVSWNHAALPLQQATDYLVRLRKLSTPFASLTDGVVGGAANSDGADYTDSNLADGTLAAYVTYPSNSLLFSNLSSGTDYQVQVIPLTISPNGASIDNWDYKFSAPLTSGTITTPSASAGSIATPFTPPTSFSSMITTLSGAVVPQANATINFQFNITDDGATPTADNADFKFSSIVIKAGSMPGANNYIADWTQAIAGAELSDGVNPAVTVTNTAVATGPNSITFNVNPATVGFIADNGTKTYTLKIALKTALGGTLPLDIDQKNFEFRVDNASFTYDNTGSASSTLTASGVESGDTNNKVDVNATGIRFTTQPIPTGVFVLTNFTTTPIAKAVDANGNVDLGFTSPSVPSVTITNTGTLGMNTTLLIPSNGVMTFPAGFQYQGAGNGTLTVTGGGLNSNSSPSLTGAAACSPVTVTYSNTTVVAANALVNSIESNKVTAATADAVFRFNVVDDNGSLGDGAPTLISQIVIVQGPTNGSTITLWKDVILGAVLSDGLNSITFDSTQFASNSTNSSITFGSIPTGIPLGVPQLGYVGDNVTKTYTLSIYLKKAQVNPLTIDGKNLVFQVANTNLTVPAASSQVSATSTNSVLGNNIIDVAATRMAFINQPASNLLVSKNISLQPPAPTIQAIDAFGNRDLNYATSLNITNQGGLQMSTSTPAQGPAATIGLAGAAGFYTFANDFLYNQIGNGTLIATPSAGGVTAAVSTPVTVGVAKSTKINSPAVAAATISSVTNISPGSTVFTFSIEDDFGAEDDGNPTLITKMVFTKSSLNNTVLKWSQAIAGARLEDNADNTKFLAIGSADIFDDSLRFSALPTTAGLLGRVNDDATKTFKLLLWLKTDLTGTENYPITIDGLTFGFDITSAKIKTDANGTALLTGLNANTTNVTTTVDVTATSIDFTNPSVPTSVSLNTAFPGVYIQARDVNNNRDLGYTGTVREFINASGVSMANAPVVGTTQFTNGVIDFSVTSPTNFTNFMFTSGNNSANVTLSMKAGANTTCGGGTICTDLTPTLTLITSSESSIVGDPTFYTPSLSNDINYHLFPEATTLTNANSFELARLLLVDGSRNAFNYTSPLGGSGSLTTNTNGPDGILQKDQDGAPTRLETLILRLTNPSNVRLIALADSTGAIISGSQQTVNVNTKTLAFKDFTFSGVPTPSNPTLFTANDDKQTAIRVRVSFWDDSTHVTDNKIVQVSVIDATIGAGSKFYNPTPATPNLAYIAGIDGSVLNLQDVGFAGSLRQIEVTATALEFVTQPSNYAGINQPISTLTNSSTGIVHARDKWAVVDLDFNYVATVTATANPSLLNNTFNKGVLDLTGMQYQNAGVGRLQIKTSDPNFLDSHIQAWRPANTCEQVDVIHVTASLNSGGGVSLVESLKGGTTNNRIFGVTFQTPHVHSGVQPTLDGFSITFKGDDFKPYPYKNGATTIFKNFKILKSINGSAPVSAAGDLTINETTSEELLSTEPLTTKKDMIKVTFINKPTLYDEKTYAFFLSVDIDVNVNNGTKPITPYLEDDGYGFPNTNNHILTSVGSSESMVQGITRKFASIKPPKLVKSIPANGKLNVDPAINFVEVYFDVPVVTFDGVAFLHALDNPTDTVAVLTASNGKFQSVLNVAASESIKTQVVDSIRFTFPGAWTGLTPDKVYFITIPKGRFSNIDTNDRAGISDDGFNLFGGISYNGTFYFKASNDTATALLETNPDNYYFTETTATFNARFDQPGKAYYMVVDKSTGTTPTTITNAEILGSAYSGTASVIKRGSFNINQVSPNFQYETFNANLTVGNDYWVYLFAENDAEPIPVRAPSPFGAFISDSPTQIPSNDFVVGAAGPTLTLKKLSPGNRLNLPSYNMCANTDLAVRMEEPIIISELATGEFNMGAVKQSFNILLPTGFQYDITKKPKLTLNGNDFKPLSFVSLTDTVVFKYINTTFLEVNFVNSASGSLDNIIISDLWILASASDLSHNIIRFGGSGLSVVASPTILGRITSETATPITFSNSFSDKYRFDLPPLNILKTVTYIPDNFIDDDGSQTVRLKPVVSPSLRDFGASFFSGSGLTDDKLTLSAVSLNSAFDITMTHTDQTGCKSTTVEQYAVYDHTSAIPELLPDPDNDQDIRVAIINPNYKADSLNNPPYPIKDLSLFDPSKVVSYQGLAGYQLLELFTSIPSAATKITDPINLDNNLPSAQIIADPDSTSWFRLLRHIPDSIAGFASDNLSTLGDSVYYKSYNWDYTSILHNDSLAKYGIVNPYTTFFKRRTLDRTGTDGLPILGQDYYTGGSLGKVEFTGKYQSTADFSVFIPFRQEVELFVPALPVVEVSGESDFLGKTPIFCQKGGSIIISGYPAASPTSIGYFVVRDSAKYNSIPKALRKDTTAAIFFASKGRIPAGFADNGNGTANLELNLLFNRYRTLRIEYTYQDNNSPAIGTGATYIRITPNPIPKFEVHSVMPSDSLNFGLLKTTFGVNYKDYLANSRLKGRPTTDFTLCENSWLWFSNEANWPKGAYDSTKYVSRTNPRWDMGDLIGTSSKPDSVFYKFNAFGSYDVSFQVESQYGCASILLIEPINVGAIPTPKFSMNGISTATGINVLPQSTFPDGNPGLTPAKFYFADSTFYDIDTVSFEAILSNDYGVAGHYSVGLLASSEQCEIVLNKQIVVVPHINADSIKAQFNDHFFPSDTLVWQVTPLSSSWKQGQVVKAVIKNKPLSDITSWATGLTSNYIGKERSFVHSPTFDITKLDRPMVSFDYIAKMAVNDGIAFEFSSDTLNITDPTKSWYRIGNLSSTPDKLSTGFNWYDEGGLASKPGSQIAFGETTASKDLGWSSTGGEWLSGRHALTEIPNSKRSHVMFRFALANVDSLNTDEGFAFDNFRIGERTRKVLIENFTNSGNEGNKVAEKAVSDMLRDFPAPGRIGTDVVQLSYHVGFPVQDPFNLDNPVDPSGRALYYNVDRTPYTRIDGIDNSTANAPYFTDFGTAAYDDRTLELAGAEIKIKADTIAKTGAFRVIPTITAVDSLTADLVVHVVLAEQQIAVANLASRTNMVKTDETLFDYTVKKMLPSAAGTKLGVNLAIGDSVVMDTLIWIPPDLSRLYGNNNDMKVIVFVQNEVTRAVLQANVYDLSRTLFDPGTITGIESPLSFEDIQIYPNPADQELNIVFPRMLEKDMPIVMVDQMGKIISSTKAYKGEKSTIIETSNLASGLYILQLDLGGGKFARTKVIVGHR